MRRWTATIGLAVVVGLVSGCTVNIGVPPPATTAQREGDSQPRPDPVVVDPSPEDDYLTFMQREAPLLYQAEPDAELLTAGYTVCTFFRDGGSGAEVVAAMMASAEATGGSAKDSAVLVYGAVANLCPEYSSELSNL